VDHHDHRQSLQGDESWAVLARFWLNLSNRLAGLVPASPLPSLPDLFFVPEQDRNDDRETEDESDRDGAEVAHDARAPRYSPISSMR
jgi:hypothetical protein